jgi:NTP pyrophosphatase (non-canonical NTP hydrolase)
MKPNLQETLRRQAQELLELARDEYAAENPATISTHSNSAIGSVHWFRHLLAPTIHFLEFLAGDAPNGKLASPAVAESCLRKLEELRENYNKIFFYPDFDARARIFNEICAERLHQDVKHGVQDHAPAAWCLILGEEVGEVNRAALENHFNGASLDNYRAELIQVAAVAVSMIECLERNKQKK